VELANPMGPHLVSDSVRCKDRRFLLLYRCGRQRLAGSDFVHYLRQFHVKVGQAAGVMGR